MNRICKTCKEEKNITEFPKNKNGKDGYESTCKTCKKIKTLERLEKNRTDLPSEKVCNTCKKLLPIENYSVNNNLKFGRSNRCKECDKKVWSVYKEANKERINREYVERYHSDPEFREHRLEIVKQVREKRKVEHPEKIILQSAKARAKEKGWDFNLDKSDIIFPTHCPILGIELIKGGTGVQTFNSPSIDRIDPKKGYIKGNVRIISLRANMMKNDASYFELQEFCKNIMKYVDNEDIVQTMENGESIELQDKEPVR